MSRGKAPSHSFIQPDLEGTNQMKNKGLAVALAAVLGLMALAAPEAIVGALGFEFVKRVAKHYVFKH